MVGIDLPELIRLKQLTFIIFQQSKYSSGLICLNWYDWNVQICFNKSHDCSCRDWSAWIDTIETSHTWVLFLACFHRRDWSAWIDTIETRKRPISIQVLRSVGIDLPELIRLKHEFVVRRGCDISVSGLICLNWYDWNDLFLFFLRKAISSSGLICLNWYDWNVVWFQYGFPDLALVGIDLPELIRLKRKKMEQRQHIP